jgi:Zn finger protein HypA/HybF involved in hydrogenase expression
VKNRARLLGVLVLLPLASLSLTTADSEEAEEHAPEAIEAADGHAAPHMKLRPSSIMGNLVFDHEMHAEEMELECDECHHETKAVPLGFPHEQYFENFWIDCDTCHHEVGSPNLEARSCYDCHNNQLRDIADERLSPKVILHKNCWMCHEVETGVEASESCELCHEG